MTQHKLKLNSGRLRFSSSLHFSFGHKRRQLLWFAVNRNPTAEWLALQVTRHECTDHVVVFQRSAPSAHSAEVRQLL